MKRYLLDTNTVSQIFRRNEAVLGRLQAVPIPSLCISAITKAEICFGLARQPDAKKLHELAAGFLRRCDVLAWNDAIAVVYGPLRADLQARGKVLSPVDTLIAAHARALDAVLVSSDRAFQQVPGLQLQDWTS